MPTALIKLNNPGYSFTEPDKVFNYNAIYGEFTIVDKHYVIGENTIPIYNVASACECTLPADFKQSNLLIVV